MARAAAGGGARSLAVRPAAGVGVSASAAEVGGIRGGRDGGGGGAGEGSVVIGCVG